MKPMMFDDLARRLLRFLTGNRDKFLVGTALSGSGLALLLASGPAAVTANALALGAVLGLTYLKVRGTPEGAKVAEPVQQEPAGQDPARLASLAAEVAQTVELELERAIGSVTDQTELTTNRISEVVNAVTEIAVSTQAVSSGAVEAEGSVQMALMAAQTVLEQTSNALAQNERALEAVVDAVEKTRAAGASMQATRAAADRIGVVSKLISDIASRTNLLALNATIEAARAGPAGRGFSVVANEVKSLATQTREATEQIGTFIQQIGASVVETDSYLRAAVNSIDHVSEATRAAADAVREQQNAAEEIASENGMAAEQSERVTGEIARIVSKVSDVSELAYDVVAQSQETDRLVRSLTERLTTSMFECGIANRRHARRIPAQFDARVLFAGKSLAAVTCDISRGGARLRLKGHDEIGFPSSFAIELCGRIELPCRLVRKNAAYLHVAFVDPSEENLAMLDRELARLDAHDAELIEMVKTGAAKISAVMEAAVQAGELRVEDLFDTTYRALQNTDPRQFVTRFTEFTDAVLPDIQEAILAADKRIVFAAAMDRNAYLPTHNAKFSHPQKPDDPVWNAANCRNRRKFDDKTGILAARNREPHIMQVYERDMGGGVIDTLKEVDAPIFVNDRHWGCLRLAYKLRLDA